jgi:hypothetical protein
MIVISEIFTVESQSVTQKNKTIFLLIEWMVDFMWIFEKKVAHLKIERIQEKKIGRT